MSTRSLRLSSDGPEGHTFESKWPEDDMLWKLCQQRLLLDTAVASIRLTFALAEISIVAIELVPCEGPSALYIHTDEPRRCIPCHQRQFFRARCHLEAWKPR